MRFSSAGHLHVLRQPSPRSQTAGLAECLKDVIKSSCLGSIITGHSRMAIRTACNLLVIEPGHSWQMTFKNAGTAAYHCRPHPNMKATLVVQGANEQSAQAGTGSPATLKWSPPRTPEEFHPILVNFTAALLPLALLSDILGLTFRRQSFHNAAWWMSLYAAVITPFTAAAGWWWKRTQGSALPAKLITVHQWLGTAVVALLVLLAIWRWSIHKRDAAPSFPYIMLAAIVVLALVYQGSLGGRMVFGK
jgi:uncharacterized membrane protein